MWPRYEVSVREKIMCKTVRGVGLTIEELECAALSVGMGSGAARHAVPKQDVCCTRFAAS